MKDNNTIITFSQTQQYFVIYYNLLVTCYSCQTIVRPTIQEIFKYVVHNKFNVIRDPIILTPVLKFFCYKPWL